MKNIDKKKVYMIFGIMLLILALSGSAYAYFSASANATLSGTAGGGDLTLNIEKLSTSATGSLIPLDNTTDMLTKATLGYGNTSSTYDSTKSCIDKNGNTACQIYKVTISNTSSVPIVLNGGVSLYGTNTPNIECAVMDSSILVTDNKSCKGKRTLANKYSLSANSTKEYYVMIYIKNIDEVQTDTGDFSGIVTFTSIDGTQLKARFEDSPAYNTLINLGLSVDEDHTPDFNTVSGNGGVKYDYNGDTLAEGLGDNTNGIYEAEDDLGTSYYFRGNVQNNIVYFAKQWWRIVRINGDGTIRMIYANTDNDSYLYKYSYNNKYNDNAYVGYMYGTAGSSTYAEAHTNTNNSTIKGIIDSWYSKNLSSYSEYIADAIYCNDRQVVTNVEFTVQGTVYTFNGDGAGTNQTAYANMQRNHLGSVNPTLKCTQKNDRFTVNDEIGNKALTYPVGLITSDEVIMAGEGVYDYSTLSYIGNEDNYLYMDGWYWTMTPFLFDAGGGGTIGSIVCESGIANGGIDVGYDYAVRPVVSLKSDAISGGSGTVDSPFYVNEEPSSSFPGIQIFKSYAT